MNFVIRKEANCSFESVINFLYPDLKYFFADASAKFRVEKWKTDLELNASNFLNVKTYNALYLSANTLTANSYTLPGRIVLLKVLFNL